VAAFIDQVRCGECGAGLTLEAASVVLQRYRSQPWLVHFWVHCDVCATHKLYWPTPRQMRLAAQLKCRTRTDDVATNDITARYSHKGLPVTSRLSALDIPDNELGFLLSMLAATGGPVPARGPMRSSQLGQLGDTHPGRPTSGVSRQPARSAAPAATR